MKLDAIGIESGTDKSSSAHDYLRTYEQLLRFPNCEPYNVLEIGVLGGDSIKMWDGYFSHPDTRIMGVDIVAWPLNHTFTDRVTIMQGDGGDPEFLRGLPHPFDFIVDDGPHFSSQQVRTFETLFPMLSARGLYCIEDLHSYAAPELSDGPENIMQYLTRIATEMQGRGAQASGKVEAGDVWASIDTITFRKGLAIVRKSNL